MKMYKRSTLRLDSPSPDFFLCPLGAFLYMPFLPSVQRVAADGGGRRTMISLCGLFFAYPADISDMPSWNFPYLQDI